MPHLSDFKALLFDVDDTLTDTSSQSRDIPPSVLEPLATLGKTKRLGVCSGRSGIALKHLILPHFTPEALHITSGGGQIVTTENKVVWEKRISGEIITQLLDHLVPLGAKIFVVQNEAVYVTTNLIDHLNKHPFQIPTRDLEKLKDFSTPLIGLHEVTPPIEEILHQFSAHFTIKRMFNTLHQRLFCDLTAIGVNKATALQKWCQLTQIDPSEVIGFGDSENDLEFLDSVGFAVAMGNATPEVKERAARVIGDVAENGLGNYLVQAMETNQL